MRTRQTEPVEVRFLRKCVLNLFSCLLLLSLAYHSFGQVLQPQPLPCLILNQPEVDILYNSGGISHPECIETVSTLNFDPTVSYSVKAGDHITFKEGAYLAPNSSNQYHAYIEQSAFDLAWYGPSQSGTVGQFEKLEIGLQFEDAINDEILNFVNDLSGNKLNPFNPDEIDVYAHFFYSEPGVGYGAAQKINGFYYEEVTRNPIGHTPVQVDHNFRFRFTPRKLGSYKCQITAIVAGHGTYHAAPFYFGCVPSTEEDFMRVGDNGHYFKVGDEPFFPVGHNLAWPLPDNTAGSTISYPQVTKFGYERHHKMIDTIKYYGGNYFRMVNAPWSTDIEFEELGNYTDRMGHAWELDQIIKHADSLDLKIHFNNNVHYTLETPNTFATYWDWPAFGDTPASSVSCFSQNDNGYCYSSIPGVQGPQDFFTNPTAIAYYKKRLRYIIARWGYAPEIAVFELFSEIPHAGRDLPISANPTYPADSSGQCYFQGTPQKPYLTDPSFPPKIYQWHEEMAKYIKNDLGHTNQLIAVNYSDTINVTWGDSSYYSPYIDVNTRNYYRESPDNMVKDFEETETVKHLGPYMHSEYGPGGQTGFCNGGTNYVKNYLLTPFTGLAATGLHWDYQRPGEKNLIQWQYMQTINDFMQGILLDEENWEAKTPITVNNEQVEVLYLQTEPLGSYNETKVVGAISNRTFNHRTMADSLPCSDWPVAPKYEQSLGFYYSDLSSGIFIPNIISQLNPQGGAYINYKIEWYDGLSGIFIGTNDVTLTGISGDSIELEYPTILTGDYFSPIFLFAVYPEGLSVKSAISTEEISETKEKADKIEEIENEISIFPNPTKDVININIGNCREFDYQLISNTGVILERKNLKGNAGQINLSTFERGIYYLYIHYDDRQYKTKLIKL